MRIALLIEPQRREVAEKTPNPAQDAARQRAQKPRAAESGQDSTLRLPPSSSASSFFPAPPRPRRSDKTKRRGLSLIEMMIALTISVTLLTSALVALDGMFKGYRQTTESASTHVVSRIVVTRLLGMLRTGSDFGPIPNDILDAGSNPIHADYFEFASARDDAGAITRITRIEFRPHGQAAPLSTWGAADDPPDSAGPYADGAATGELWFVLLDPNGGDPVVLEQHPLLSGVGRAVFTLAFGIGPRLERATIDLTVAPNDSTDLTIHTDNAPRTIRLVASAAPRQSLE